MASGCRTSQTVLVAGFLAISFGVPLGQIGVELWRGEPVQFTDLFRHAPTQRHLRDFEQGLEDQWWGQRIVRPATQGMLFAMLGDTGAKALRGRGDWMFFRPGVRYIAESDRPGRDGVAAAIVEYRDQLKQHGIELLVVPVPGKASVYPDRLTHRFDGNDFEFRSPTEELIEKLADHQVETVDLFARFREARRGERLAVSEEAYYLTRDTHWTPAGAKVAAEAVARRMRGLGWAPERPWDYTIEQVRVARRGDVPQMMQIPGRWQFASPQMVDCRRIVDRLAGPMVPSAGGRDGRFINGHLVDTPLQPAILLLGDSYSRIYQIAEPASLGELIEPTGDARAHVREKGTSAVAGKRLLPGSAGFPSLLMWELKAPVDYVVSDGGAATDVRRRLHVDPEILEGKKVVIWQFAERDIGLGRAGWQTVPLPPLLEAGLP